MSTAVIAVGTPVADRILYRSTSDASGCLTWTAFCDRDGYGWLSVDGRLIAAHRASYTAFVGPIPTRCQRGHEFTAENTGRHGTRQHRFCRTCRRLSQNQRRAAARRRMTADPSP